MYGVRRQVISKKVYVSFFRSFVASPILIYSNRIGGFVCVVSYVFIVVRCIYGCY